ncbi:MAG TPA: protein kinase, partial [Candidatus Eisenbacteria bacterium]
MIGRRLLHYEVLSELGAGGMGRVYLARDTRADRRVALKLLASDRARDPTARERLVREARAAARLSHPGVVTLLAVEEDQGEVFLIEEYVEGESLARRLERGRLSAPEVVRLARELAAALAHAHRLGV